MVYITTGTKTISAANGLLIQVNKAFTGTITLAAGGITFAVITDPTVGTQYRYNGLRGQGAITAVASTTVDATISLLNREI